MISGSNLYSRKTSCHNSDDQDDNLSSFAINSDSLLMKMLSTPKQIEEES